VATPNRGFSITPILSGSEAVKVMLVVVDAGGERESKTECYVLGMSNVSVALGWEDSVGVVHVDTAEPLDLPARTRQKIISMTTRKGCDQAIMEIEITFSDHDFRECEVTLPGGILHNAHVITKDCPLFGKTCDSDMKATLICCVTA
jgi:hypothetical protein